MDNKVIVQRANVVLYIDPEQLDYYMSQGYNVINDAGKVIRASVPNDLGTLQKAYVEHMAEIKSLKQQIEELKALEKTPRSKK